MPHTVKWLMQAAAAKEAERVRAEADAKRRAFEADEAALAAELQQRTEAERRILEDAAERARAALEQRRRHGCFTARAQCKVRLAVSLIDCGCAHAHALCMRTHKGVSVYKHRACALCHKHLTSV